MVTVRIRIRDATKRRAPIEFVAHITCVFGVTSIRALAAQMIKANTIAINNESVYNSLFAKQYLNGVRDISHLYLIYIHA